MSIGMDHKGSYPFFVIKKRCSYPFVTNYLVNAKIQHEIYLGKVEIY